MRVLGEVLAAGVRRAGLLLGRGATSYVFHSKGLEMTAYDPRAAMGIALSYAVSSRGADFTSVYPVPEYRWDAPLGEEAFGQSESVDRYSIAGTEGAPFVHGSGLHHIDMKTTISVYGVPEFQLARVAVAEMGRYYDLPTWGYAGHSDSCVMDAQAVADAAISVTVALQAGNNLVHDIGCVEAGLTTSPELIFVTAEIISMMRRFM